MRRTPLLSHAPHTSVVLCRCLKLIFLALVSLPIFAEFMTHMSPETNQAFDKYEQHVEQQLKQQQADGSCLALDANKELRDRARSLELVIHSGSGSNGIAVPGGIIHDWDGAMFITGVKVQQVLNVLEDFDKHKDRFPEVIASHTIERNDHTVRGYWRLRKKKVITVVLDVEQTAKYSEIHPGRAATTSVSEIDNAGTPEERKLPPGDGHGFLWRLNAYWILEQASDGVYAECRTVSLSRNIPFAVSWVVKPFVESMPRESLVSTLEGIRKAAKE
jgi:hypothetical protein